MYRIPAIVLLPLLANPGLCREEYKLSNESYRLTVTCAGGEVNVILYDELLGLSVTEGPYIYRATVRGVTDEGLEDVSVKMGRNRLTIRGKIAGLDLEHVFVLPRNRGVMEEMLILRNRTSSRIDLEDLEAGFQRRVTDEEKQVLPDFQNDRWIAVPFRHRADDPQNFYNDYSVSDLLTQDGYEPSIDENLNYSRLPSSRHCSEGWAWLHGNSVLGVFKYNQKHMEFSTISKHAAKDGDCLRFGGACMVMGEPAALTRIEPGQTVNLGVTRYESVRGGYTEALYAFRQMMDEKRCRFPKGYNPPVHWNQLYNMSGAWEDRANRYTKAIVEQEAVNAKAYSCESLYLDPGWDTDFGTFLWGEKWLGPRKEFIEEMKAKYDLAVSLHCPLATWMSHDKFTWGKHSVQNWPAESRRLSPAGVQNTTGPLLCLGSKQYRDVAETRLLENCRDGVVFLMFDGNWWNGGCENPDHGHPVPYRMEDHIQANLELAQRVHAKYPGVLIEMHDMIAGGTSHRQTPVYYKYGLPGSYDDNWGFELMWEPLADIKEGRATALYYYNMGCNIPAYLHIDLRKDNENCLVLWWYASTCRHLGIGGTHADPRIAEAQKKAMRRYRELERFYKRGEFYGISEEIHLHVLPEQDAFVVNVFNLSDETRTISGEMDLAAAGLDRKDGSAGWAGIQENRLEVKLEMPPWSTELCTFGVE